MATLTFYPAAGANIPADGYVFNQTGNSTFSGLRNGSGSLADASVENPLIQLRSDFGIDKYDLLMRLLFSFDTSSIPDGATITSASLFLYGTSKANGLGKPDLHIVGGSPSTTFDLIPSDYSALGSISFGSIDYDSFSTSGYNEIVLNAAGINQIDDSGVTCYGARLSWDLFNSFTGTWASSTQSYLGLYMADRAGTSQDPKLVINYGFFTEIWMAASSTLSGTCHVTHHPTATLSGAAEIDAIASNLEDQSSVAKSYLYKVYDSENNFLGVWKDVMTEFTYSQEINSAGSAIEVELARNSDSRIIGLQNLITTHTDEDITTQDGDTLVLASESSNNIGPGSDVDVNYRVEVWAFFGQITELSTTSGELILTASEESIMVNDGSVNGRRKFNGYITRYVSRYGSTETVMVSISSFGVELDNFVLESDGDTTVPFNSFDPGAIVRAGMDLFNADGGIVSYDTGTVDLSSTTVSYTFRVNTYLEVIKKALELAPYDWFWYVGLGDDLLYFQAKPATPSHYFVLGKHVESLNLEYSIEEITNLVYFTGGETAGVNLFKKYQDASSIANYRQGLQRISDHRVTLETSADQISEAEIERNTAPRYRSSITILDESYQIEEISLGQVIGFRNFGNWIDGLTMQIVAIDYEPDRVRLQLDTLLPSVNKRIEDLTRNLNELENINVPDTPS